MHHALNHRSFATIATLLACCMTLPQAGAATLLEWAPNGNNTGDLTTTGTSKSGRTLSQDTAITVVRGNRVNADGIDGNIDDNDYYEGTLSGSGSYTGDAVADGWNANDINASGFGGVTKTNAVTNGDFLSIVLSASQAVNINSISFELWRNGNGAPDDYAIYYRIGEDALSDFDATGTGFTQAGGAFNVSGAGYSNASDAPSELAFLTSSGLDIDFGTSAVDSQIEIRLYGFGTGNDGGNTHITGGQVLGVIPEPGSMALLFAASLMLLPRRFTAATQA